MFTNEVFAVETVLFVVVFISLVFIIRVLSRY